MGEGAEITIADLPVSAALCKEVTVALAGWDASPSKIASILARDPFLVLKVFDRKNENALTQAVSLEEAVKQIGPDELRLLIDSLENDSQKRLLSSAQLQVLEELRRTSHQTASIARVLAEKLAGESGDACFMVALFAWTGEMLAAISLGQAYADLHNKVPCREERRNQLEAKFGFNAKEEELKFLGSLALFEGIHTSDEQDADPAFKLRRAITMAAMTLIEKHEVSKQQSPADSPELEEKNMLHELASSVEQQREIVASIYQHLGDSEEGQVEVSAPAPESSAPLPAITPPESEPEPPVAPPQINQKVLDTYSIPVDFRVESESEQPSIEYDTKASTPVVIVGPHFQDGEEGEHIESIAPPTKPEIAPRRLSDNIDALTDVINAAEDTISLLSSMLEILVENVFERAALLVISDAERLAIAVSIRGENTSTPESLSFSHPLSPFSTRASTIQSFAVNPKDCSPFGSKAYALAPIDVSCKHPVALYADCGQDVILDMHARAVFRAVVERLNKRLPSLPGTLPIR